MHVGQSVGDSTFGALEKWHHGLSQAFSGNDASMLLMLEDIMDEDVVFLAPTYGKERKNKAFTVMALVGVGKAFKNFKYTRIFIGDKALALEFSCNIETEQGLLFRGIDLITLNDDGKIVRFEVMGRPPKAALKLLELQTAFMRSAGLIPPARL